ncbi:MAG: polymer-forming cytoskeletal protein [Phycisphaerales bacterium]
MALKRKSTGPRGIHCYKCGHEFEVSAKTMSTTCPNCNKAIQVEDIVVKSYVPVNDLQTCGSISVTRRGRIAAKNIQGGSGVKIEGTIEGSVESHAEVSLGAKASWKGNLLRCATLEIKDGASIEGRIEVPIRRDGD